jgi:hypothetical protein
MGTMSQNDDNYKFKGLPLTAAVAEHVVLLQLAGRQIKTISDVLFSQKRRGNLQEFPMQRNYC